MSTGDLAYVTANNNLYLYSVNGWFLVATVANASPTAITGVSSAYTLATDATATVVTAVSTDPEGFPLTWSYAVTTGSLTNGGGATATVSQSDNVFTITPTTTEAYAGTFSITFTVTDGVNGAVNSIGAFTLEFAYDWTATTQQQKLVASNRGNNDRFGQSVSISGDTVICGAVYEDTTASNAGAAYIYTRSGTTWTQQQLIQSSDIAASDYFGRGVGIDSDTVVVGAYAENAGSDNSGSAYVFTRSGTTWTQQAKLVASDAQANDNFGVSVAISGDTLIAGAYLEDTGGDGSGAAYVFTRSGTTWTQQQKLVASDAAASDYFGWSVSISGDTVIVGAYKEDTGTTDAGAAYIFTRSGTTWSQQQKIQASDRGAYDYFGYSVAISDDTVIAGAVYDDGSGNDANVGSAYIFTRSGTTWSQQQKIMASDNDHSDEFGTAVGINGDVVIVGAASAKGPSWESSAGAAYIFTRDGTTWTQDKIITASDLAANDAFGNSVAIDSDTIVVAAYGEAYAAGAAYVFIGG
jgi:hypothetical protein